MELLEKIKAAEKLYDDKPDELKSAITALLDKAEVKDRTITYAQETEELLNEAGWFRKYMPIFAKHNPEFNKRLLKLEQELGKGILTKTKPYKERLTLKKGAAYGVCTGLGALLYTSLGGAAVGFLFGVGFFEFYIHAARWSQVEPVIKRRVRNLDEKIAEYTKA